MTFSSPQVSQVLTVLGAHQAIARNAAARTLTCTDVSQVELAHQHQPYGPDTWPSIEALQAQGRNLLAAAKQAQARVVPRPSPSQYMELQAEARRFLDSMGSSSRLLRLVHTLQVCTASCGKILVFASRSALLRNACTLSCKGPAKGREGRPAGSTGPAS